MDFDENWWKLFLQASRSSLNRPGPAKTYENRNVEVKIFELTTEPPRLSNFYENFGSKKIGFSEL